MTDKGKRRRRRLPGLLGILACLIILFMVWFHFAIRVNPPEISDLSSIRLKTENPEPDFYRCEENWLKKNSNGLWEMYLEGKPFERGVINGKLCKPLIEKQEIAFLARIRELVPSGVYLGFLKQFVYWFNRDLDKYFTEEYRQEIYGISLSASGKFSSLGTNYQRMLNYHSAHDIGHMVQNLGLVGCTSFGVWSGKTVDSSLLIGRNFDFYVGDQFAETKIICFEKPEEGYPFIMITWPAMIGAVSGMNEKGLTVTINAARSDIPFSARTPISILAREILQYAKNIGEASAIAGKRETFVSESILIGSASDNKAVIIEKTTRGMEIVDPHSDHIVCTNHFQSGKYSSLPANIKDLRENASGYRFKKVIQDISGKKVLGIPEMAEILRDQSGLNHEDLGMGNEKAINQLICHHSVIFQPEKLLVWVSTDPWQLGPYLCYDLKKIIHTFAGLEHKMEITERELSIPGDSFLTSANYKHFRRFREMRKIVSSAAMSKSSGPLTSSFIHEFIDTNPGYFEVYSLTGEYYQSRDMPDSSIRYYRKALEKNVPRQSEKNRIISELSDCIIKVKRKQH